MIVLVTTQLAETQLNYQNEIKYSMARIPLHYDYSCDEPVHGLYMVITNIGNKVVQNFSISITNGICEGSVPSVPNSFSPLQKLEIYLYSTNPNGTVTISGNNTRLLIHF